MKKNLTLIVLLAVLAMGCREVGCREQKSWIQRSVSSDGKTVVEKEFLASPMADYSYILTITDTNSGAKVSYYVIPQCTAIPLRTDFNLAPINGERE